MTVTRSARVEQPSPVVRRAGRRYMYIYILPDTYNAYAKRERARDSLPPPTDRCAKWVNLTYGARDDTVSRVVEERNDTSLRWICFGRDLAEIRIDMFSKFGFFILIISNLL